MGIIDLVVFITIIVSVLFALYRGLLRELLGISSWILAGIAALYSYHPLFSFLTGKVEKVNLWSLSLSGSAALIILVVMTILNANITQKLRKSSLSGLDRILGTAFGIVRALLLIVLVWLFTAQMAFTPDQIKQMDKENFSVKYIQEMAQKVEKILPNQPTLKHPSQAPKTEKKRPPKPEVEYKEADRKALDEMMEDIVEIEDL